MDIGASKYKRPRRKPELSIAPLIDCVFLLLIFFATSTTFVKDQGLQIERPQAATGVSLPAKNLYLSIDQKGALYKEGKPIELETLNSIIKKMLLANPKMVTVINADKNSKTQNLIDVLDECKLSGATKIAVATEEE